MLDSAIAGRSSQAPCWLRHAHRCPHFPLLKVGNIAAAAHASGQQDARRHCDEYFSGGNDVLAGVLNV